MPYSRAAITELKGYEPRLYVAIRFFAGLFFEFITINLKGPNKTLNHKKVVSDITVDKLVREDDLMTMTTQ